VILVKIMSDEALIAIVKSIAVEHDLGCWCKKCITDRLDREKERSEELTDYNGTSIVQEEDV